VTNAFSVREVARVRLLPPDSLSTRLELVFAAWRAGARPNSMAMPMALMAA
jgi:hypothetical protein